MYALLLALLIELCNNFPYSSYTLNEIDGLSFSKVS